MFLLLAVVDRELHPFVTALSSELTAWAQRRQLRPAMTLSDRGMTFVLDPELTVLVAPRELGQPHLLETGSFDVAYLSSREQLPPAKQRLLEELVDVVARVEREVDDAGLVAALGSLAAELEEPGGAETFAPLPSASVKLLRECNVDCTFCAAGPLTHPRSEQELVELLRSLRGRGIETVNFDGGEATLSPLLLPGIRAARHIGFRHVQVVTNGVRLASRRFVRSLVDAGLDRVTFSLHAVDSATSRAIYGRDVHARQLRALEQIRQTEPPLGLSMSIVLVAANRASLGAILETVAAQRPEQISLKYCLPVLYSGRIANVPLAVLEDGEVLRVVQAFLQAHPDQQLELQHFPYCQLPAELWPLVREHGPAAATAPTRWRILESSRHPNQRLCSGCDHRDLCSFPLRAYLLQRRNGAQLLRGLALSLLGDDALSRGFRGAAPSS